MKQISAHVRPGGGFPPGLFIGDELAKPAADLPAGTRITHANAVLLYRDAGGEQIKVIDSPGRAERRPIFPLHLYKTAQRHRKGTILYRKGEPAKVIYHDLTEGRYFPVEAMLSGKYPETYSIPVNSTLLSIGIAALLPNESAGVKGLISEFPQMGLDILEDLSVRGYYQLEAYLAGQQTAFLWTGAGKSLIWAVCTMFRHVEGHFTGDEEHPISVALGREDFDRLKSYVKALRDKFLLRLKADKLADAFATYDEFTEVAGSEADAILGRDPSTVWSDHSMHQFDDDSEATDLFERADQASRALKDMLDASESAAAGPGGEPGPDEARPVRKLDVEGFLRSSGKEQTVLIYEPGDVVFAQGDLGTEVYLMLEGRLDSLIERYRIAALGRNNFFGHLTSFMTRRRDPEQPPQRLVTVAANTQCKLLAMTRAGFIATLRKKPSYFKNLLSQFARDQERFSPDKAIFDPKRSKVNFDPREAPYLDGVFREAVKYYYLAFERMREIDNEFKSTMAEFLSRFERDYLLDRFIPGIKDLHKFGEGVFSRQNCG